MNIQLYVLDKRAWCDVWRRVFVLVACWCGLTALAFAQSNDASLPTPLSEPVIEAMIAPLDIGDARLTRHYYVFTGRAGDLQIAVRSENLNGDIDIFTFDTLRPLSKVTLLAGGGESNVEKSVFVRRDETLLLRVEARAAGDDAGRYRVSLSGGFASAPESFFIARNNDSQLSVEERRASGEQVNSAGAKIETRAAASVEASDSTAANASTNNENTPASVVAKTDDAGTERVIEAPRATRNTRTTPRRSTAANAPRNRRAPRTPRPKTKRESGRENAANDNAKAESAIGETAAREPNIPKPNDKTNADESSETDKSASSESASNESTAETEASDKPVESLPQLRLVIETRDGRRIERLMSNVRRVTIENGELIVILKTGNRERLRLSNVARTVIEP